MVDRGPGAAGQLGTANFGGSINLFSPEVTEDRRGSLNLTGGSWNTFQGVARFNTGSIEQLHDARAAINLSALSTDGYLTESVYNLDRWRLEAAVYNLLDSERLTKLSQGGKVFNTLSATDQYYYQPERSFQLSARVNF